MGGIADYSGSLVLQWPLREATLAALQLDPEPRVRVVSLGAEANGRDASFEIAPGRAASRRAARSTTQTRARCFARDRRRQWAAYVAGALLVLARERSPASDVRPAPADPLGRAGGQGRQLVRGAGGRDHARHGHRVSASRSQPRDLALLCQKVENLVVGAPCGVMDQMTAACGRAGELLALLCQPAELQGTLAVPDEIEIWGIDSHVRHAVSGLGLRTRAGGCLHGRPHPGGANRPAAAGWRTSRPSELASLLADLPEEMTGEEFLRRYGGTTDTVTRVDPARTYAVRQPTSHPCTSTSACGRSPSCWLRR